MNRFVSAKQLMNPSKVLVTEALNNLLYNPIVAYVVTQQTENNLDMKHDTSVIIVFLSNTQFLFSLVYFKIFDITRKICFK